MQLDYTLFMLMGFTAACYVLDPTNIKKEWNIFHQFQKDFIFQLPSYNRRYISSQDFHLLCAYNCYDKDINITASTLHIFSFC
jgi:hypothetical protein